jgi:hypothetical protein
MEEDCDDSSQLGAACYRCRGFRYVTPGLHATSYGMILNTFSNLDMLATGRNLPVLVATAEELLVTILRLRLR